MLRVVPFEVQALIPLDDRPSYHCSLPLNCTLRLIHQLKPFANEKVKQTSCNPFLSYLSFLPSHWYKAVAEEAFIIRNLMEINLAWVRHEMLQGTNFQFTFWRALPTTMTASLLREYPDDDLNSHSVEHCRQR